MIPPITGGSDRNLLCLHTASRFILLFSTLRARVLKYIIALILYLSRGKCNVGCIFVDKGKGCDTFSQLIKFHLNYNAIYYKNVKTINIQPTTLKTFSILTRR